MSAKITVANKVLRVINHFTHHLQLYKYMVVHFVLNELSQHFKHIIKSLVQATVQKQNGRQPPHCFSEACLKRWAFSGQIIPITCQSKSPARFSLMQDYIGSMRHHQFQGTVMKSKWIEKYFGVLPGRWHICNISCFFGRNSWM